MSTDERMEKMEAQLARIRWFNRCLIACIVLSLGAWFILKTFSPQMAWPKSGAKEIRAKRFVLEDENGKPRAVLGMNDDGPGSGLALFDENGKNRAQLLVLNDGSGSGLALFDENGKNRATLLLDKDGPGLSLNDENGITPRAVLGTRQETMPDGKVIRYAESSLALCGADGKVIWSAP